MENRSKNPKVVSFIGKSGTGKTTLIEKLIKILSGKNYRVSTIKHTDHKIKADIEGKDSWRHKNAGAFSTMLVSNYSMAFFSDVKGGLTLEDIAARFFQNSDIIIIEGFKDLKTPKIELFRKEINPDLELKYINDPSCILICGDVFINGTTKAQISINEPEKIARFLEEKIIGGV